MTGTTRSAQRLRKPLHLDPGLCTVGIEFFHVRMKDPIHPMLGGEFKIALQGHGIRFEITRIIELGRIHEDRNPDHIRVRPRHFDQGQMAGVQSPHRGHQSDPLPSGAEPIRLRSKRGAGVDHR